MDNYDTEELARLLGVFQDRGWNTKHEILSLFDVDADWSAIEGVGPKRAPIMKALMSLSADKWYEVTGLLPYEGYIPPEHDEQPAVLPQDSPGPSLAGSIGIAHEPPIDNGRL